MKVKLKYNAFNLNEYRLHYCLHFSHAIFDNIALSKSKAASEREAVVSEDIVKDGIQEDGGLYMELMSPLINNDTVAKLQKNIGNVPSSVFFVAYAGPSMNPTLREPEVMEIMPYDSRLLCIGDVALFVPPKSEQMVVHRIIRITRAGITTRGDNNKLEDSYFLRPDRIKGQVVAAWRGRQKCRKIAGGLQGRLIGHWNHWRCVLDRGMSPLLHPVYQAISHSGVIARMLPAPWQPRVIVFHARGKDQFQLLLGQHIIGRYDEYRHQWQIRRPFRLFVDASALTTGYEEIAD